MYEMKMETKHTYGVTGTGLRQIGEDQKGEVFTMCATEDSQYRYIQHCFGTFSGLFRAASRTIRFDTNVGSILM